MYVDSSCFMYSDIKCKRLNTFYSTLKCLKIGTPKIINFPFVPNGKLMVFRCPKIKAH